MSKLSIIITVLLLSCNGKGGGSSKKSDPVIDPRLYSGAGDWLGYTSSTNVDDNLTFTQATDTHGNPYIRMHLRSEYRGGSQIADSNYSLTAISNNLIYATELNGTLMTGDLAGEYSFSDNDHFELCFDGADCVEFERAP